MDTIAVESSIVRLLARARAKYDHVRTEQAYEQYACYLGLLTGPQVTRGSRPRDGGLVVDSFGHVALTSGPTMKRVGDVGTRYWQSPTNPRAVPLAARCRPCRPVHWRAWQAALGAGYVCTESEQALHACYLKAAAAA